MAEAVWRTIIIVSGILLCIIRDMGPGEKTKYVENVKQTAYIDDISNHSYMTSIYQNVSVIETRMRLFRNGVNNVRRIVHYNFLPLGDTL